MAGVRKKGDGWHCTFRFQGRRYYFALGNVTEEQARARGVDADEVLGLIERGRLPDCLDARAARAQRLHAPVLVFSCRAARDSAAASSMASNRCISRCRREPG